MLMLALLDSAYEYRRGHMYEIVIGGWENAKSAIRYGLLRLIHYDKVHRYIMCTFLFGQTIGEP